MVFTIEPGIYVPGWGGVRIEDMVLVEADGCRVLTSSAKGIEESML
jgi:Xaa-Pro aminopeptidase